MYPSNPFDVNRLRIPHSGHPVPVGPKQRIVRCKRARKKTGGLFLKGPIPWRWLAVAARLPGRALAVGLVLWHLVGLKSCRTVRLSPSTARSLGLSPRTARRGLVALEDAGLAAVDHHRGRSPNITVLDVAEPSESSDAAEPTDSRTDTAPP